MFLKFFKQTLPQVIIVSILLAILMWVKNLNTEQVFPYYFDSIKMPFYAFISKWLQNNYLLSKGLTFLIMILSAFYLLQINSKHIVIKQRTYLPALFYILFTSSIISLQRINPAIFSALIFVFVFDHILSIYHKENALDDIFKAGFYLALASLFYAPSILYFIALLFSIMTIRSFNIREWFAAFFGVITPLFFFFFYHYFVNNDIQISYKIFDLNLFTPVNQDNDSLLIYIFYGYGILLFLVTSFYQIKSLPTQKINVRKYHSVFFWFNLVSVLALVFIPCISVEIIYIAIIPLTFQFANYFTMSNSKFWPEFHFVLLITIVALMQFY